MENKKKFLTTPYIVKNGTQIFKMKTEIKTHNDFPTALPVLILALKRVPLHENLPIIVLTIFAHVGEDNRMARV